jgi:hypothetical protein
MTPAPGHSSRAAVPSPPGLSSFRRELSVEQAPVERTRVAQFAFAHSAYVSPGCETAMVATPRIRAPGTNETAFIRSPEARDVNEAGTVTKSGTLQSLLPIHSCLSPEVRCDLTFSLSAGVRASYRLVILKPNLPQFDRIETSVFLRSRCSRLAV